MTAKVYSSFVPRFMFIPIEVALPYDGEQQSSSYIDYCQTEEEEKTDARLVFDKTSALKKYRQSFSNCALDAKVSRVSFSTRIIIDDTIKRYGAEKMEFDIINVVPYPDYPWYFAIFYSRYWAEIRENDQLCEGERRSIVLAKINKLITNNDVKNIKADLDTYVKELDSSMIDYLRKIFIFHKIIYEFPIISESYNVPSVSAYD